MELCRASAIPDSIVAPLWTPKEPLSSRFKVKAAIGGTIDQPVVGFVDDSRQIRGLLDCPLLHPALNTLLEKLVELISQFSLTPYDIAARTGELKYVLAVLDPTAQHGIVRFVTRSSECHPRIRKALNTLVKQLSWIKVVTTTIQEKPAALLEGPTDEFVTSTHDIPFKLDLFTLHVGPRSFIQVTPAAADALYCAGREIARRYRPKGTLDLYCGVGGFAFACSPYSDKVLGVEVSDDAVGCAQRACKTNAINNCTFVCGDVAAIRSESIDFQPDMIVVNPPRAGLRDSAVELITAARPACVAYSSCNPQTLFRDLALFADSYQVMSVRPFDMFPCTDHLEVLVELQRHGM